MFSVELELEEGMVTQLWLHRDWQLLLVKVLSSPLFGEPPSRKTLRGIVPPDTLAGLSPPKRLGLSGLWNPCS